MPLREIPSLQILHVQNGTLDSNVPLPFSPTAVDRSSDGARLAVAGNVAVLVLDVQTKTPIYSLELQPPTHSQLEFSPDSALLRLGRLSGNARAASLRALSSTNGNVVTQFPESVSSFALSPSGKYLAIGLEGSISVWRLK